MAPPAQGSWRRGYLAGLGGNELETFDAVQDGAAVIDEKLLVGSEEIDGGSCAVLAVCRNHLTAGEGRRRCCRRRAVAALRAA